MAAVSPCANAEFIIEVSNNRPATAPATKAKPSHPDLPPVIAASHKVVYTALNFDQADWPAGQQLYIAYRPCGAGARRIGLDLSFNSVFAGVVNAKDALPQG
jgi:hypothetical protein